MEHEARRKVAEALPRRQRGTPQMRDQIKVDVFPGLCYSSSECFLRLHGSPTLDRSAYQPSGRSANSTRLGSRSIGWWKQEMTGPPPSDMLSPKNCHAPSSISCETYVTASIPL